MKPSAIYILLGRMTFAISVIYYLRWRGGLVLAAGASHQMVCFLYFGDRWPPVAVHGVKGDAFQSGGRFVLLYIVAVSVFPPPPKGGSRFPKEVSGAHPPLCDLISWIQSLADVC